MGRASRTPLYGTSLPELPDIEGAEGGYDIVYIAAERGDAIVHHANTVHGAGATWVEIRTWERKSQLHRRRIAGCRCIGSRGERVAFG